VRPVQPKPDKILMRRTKITPKLLKGLNPAFKQITMPVMRRIATNEFNALIARWNGQSGSFYRGKSVEAKRLTACFAPPK